MSDAATNGDTREKAAPRAEAASRADKSAAENAASGRVARRLVAALVLMLVLAGGVLQVLASHTRRTSAPGDRALVDAEATSVVIGDVSNGLTKIFSYAPQSTAATEQAAADVLSGPAAQQYRTLFEQVTLHAAAEELTVNTRVVRAGVTRLTGDSAQLLVFMDQVFIRRDRPNGTSAAAQLSVTARRIAGHWRIVDIHAR